MTVVGYEPLVPTVYLNLAGSQWGNTYRDETILVLNQGGQLGELLMSGQSAACIQNESNCESSVQVLWLLLPLFSSLS